MSKIISYDFNTVKSFMQNVSKSYKSNLTQLLEFEQWKVKSLPRIFDAPNEFHCVKVPLNKKIRIAPTCVEMLKETEKYKKQLQDIDFNCPNHKKDFEKTKVFNEIFKPVNVIEYTEYPTVKGKTKDGETVDVPVWFNTTMKGLNIRPGFAQLDSSLPGAVCLNDDNAHMMLGGKTGAGKSVLIHTCVASALLEYPPWEVNMFLADFKIVELCKYGDIFPTPHVEVIAATSSTEFVLSVFQALIKEMEARQALFNMTGTANLKDFREKFDLAVPRFILMVDEFVQMHENVKIAEAAGNDKASEMQAEINQNISGVARLGRSSGVHMLLSSQQLEGVLDEQTSNQFNAGITLKATPQISNSLIGNPAGASILGKGKCYANSDKMRKDASTNVIHWVPFIESALPKDAEEGALTYLYETLGTLTQLAEKYNWTRKPVTYSERDPIPIQLLDKQLEECVRYFNEPDEGSDIKNEIFKDTTALYIPLGQELVYKKDNTAYFAFQRKARNNIIVDSSDNQTVKYILELLFKGVDMYPAQNVILTLDKILSQEVDYKGLLSNHTVLGRLALPQKYFNMVQSRKKLLGLQDIILDEGIQKCWDGKIALDYVISGLSKDVFYDVPQDIVMEIFEDLEYIVHDLTSVDIIRECIEDTYKEDVDKIIDVLAPIIAELNTLRATILKLTGAEENILTAGTFNPIILWWLGVDSIETMGSYESKEEVVKYLTQCCQVGVFNVFVADKWDKLSSVYENCNFVLEKSFKDFFESISLPKNININPNSFQVHDKDGHLRRIIRTFNV